MTDDRKEQIVTWLRDAHAMENQALQMMEALTSRLENYPELNRQIQQHIEETRGQAERVAECIRELGGDTSTLKDSAARLTAMAQGLSGIFVGDEVVKGALASYAFEHFEIASYRSLIAAAEELGHDDVRAVCEENLREEEAMADWLAGHLKVVTKQYLEREASSEEAKR